MNSAERESRMTTAESATRMDTSSPDYTGTEKKKPSILKKVTAKAKKLKSKLKPGHHEHAKSDTPHVENENVSSSSSSGEEEESQEVELGYTPLSEAVNMDDDKRTAHAEQRDLGRSGVGQAIPEEDSSAPKTGLGSVPPSQYKSPGPAGVEQAVPTSYNYYNQDPASAAAPSDFRTFSSSEGDKPSGEFTSQSRDLGSDTSGAGGNPFSTGESGSLQDDTSNTAAADRPPEEDRDAKIPPGILAPVPVNYGSSTGRGDDDSFSSGRNYEQDVGMATPETKVTDNVAEVKDAALEKVGYGSTDDQNPIDDSKRSVDDSPSTDNYSPEAQKPIHQRAYEGLTGAAVGMGQKLGAYRDYDHAPGDETTTSSSEPTIAQKAYDTVVGTKDAGVEKLSQNTTTSSSEPTVAQKAYDTIVGTKDAGVDKLSQNTNTSSSEPTLTQKVYDTVVGTKDAGVDKLSQNTNTSSSEPTMTQKVYDTVVGTKDAGAEKLGQNTRQSEPSVTQKAYDTLVGTKDAVAAKLPQAEGVTQTREPTMAQKAYDTVVGTKDTAALNLSGDGSASKPVTQKLAETGAGLKETVASRLGYEGSATNTPGEEMVRNTRDTVVEKARQADLGLSSDSTPVSQKAADTAYRAKDSTVSTLNPSEDDKALSQSVTETIQNLPALVTEKLGLGGGSPASNTTKDFQGPSELKVQVSNSPSQVSPGADTPDSAAAGTPTNAPGIVNRVTDAVSSLFGGAKKTSVGTGEEYRPTVSPSGSGRRDATDTSPMVTDVGGEDTPRSSPAA